MSAREIPQSNVARERGAPGIHTNNSSTSSNNTSSTNSLNNMKVQDRIHAMNRVLEQEELLEPLEMLSGDNKSPGSYPKRSSVVEMWKKREGTIKKVSSSSATRYQNKFEEKKEVHNEEQDQFQYGLRQAESGDFVQDVQQQYTMTAMESSSSPHIVTPDRNGHEMSEDSGSNVGSGHSSVRRSHIRDSWKKRAPQTVQSFSTPSNTMNNAVDVSIDSTASGQTEEQVSLEYRSVSTPSENEFVLNTDPSSTTPYENSGVGHNSWRKSEDLAFQQAPETPRSKGMSSIDRSQSRDSGTSEIPSTSSATSAFDELRSKWAKFGVQQEKAGAAGRVRQSMPSPVAAQSPKISTPRTFKSVPYTPDRAQKEVFIPQLATPTHVSKRSLASKIEGEASVKSSSKVGEGSPSSGGRKSQLVKMGQLHASRPKADFATRSTSPIKRYNQLKHSPKSSNKETYHDHELNEKLENGMQTDFSLKRSALQKSVDAKAFLRAKHRRRAQQAQSTTAAAVPQHNLEDHFQKMRDASDDSFPLDEMDPDAFGSRSRTTADDTMVRNSLPMRTLFGSQSGESLELGPTNDKFSPYFPDPRQMTKTDVMKTTFDSWSEIESFSGDTPHVASNDSEFGNGQPSSSSLTNSALKRLREKRQKNLPPKFADGVSSGNTAFPAPKTPEPGFRSSAYQHSSLGLPRPPGSPDASSAVSQSVNSDTSYSNSYMQSTVASGYTKETGTLMASKDDKLRSTLKDVVPDAKDMIPDEFVTEKNASVQSFRNAYENLSLEQIAKDMQDEASSVLSIDFLNHELLNKGMNAAGASLNKLVAGDMFPKQSQRRILRRPTSPFEEVAIEVEYIADSEDDR